MLATDEGGVQAVVWVRIPTGFPGAAQRWELRRDDAPEHTRRGLGTPAFAALVLLLIAVVIGSIALISWSARRP